MAFDIRVQNALGKKPVLTDHGVAPGVKKPGLTDRGVAIELLNSVCPLVGYLVRNSYFVLYCKDTLKVLLRCFKGSL